MRKLSETMLVRILVLASALLLSVDSFAQEKKEPARRQEISFDEYLTRVGRDNLGFMADKLNLDAAQAEVMMSKMLPDPSLDMEGGQETFSLGLSYTLELGKRKARINLAKSQLEYEGIAFEQEFRDLRAQAAELFLDAILQKELLASRRSSYDYMSELSQSDSLRFLSGEITENDARQSRLEAITLLNDVYDQESAYYSALVELNRFMGVDADTLCIPAGDWSHLDRDFILDSLHTAGMALRQDLLASDKAIDIASKEYKLAKRERIPDIDLSLSYEREWGHYLPKGEYATLGVSIPLPFSASNKGSRKQAMAHKRQAELQYRDMVLQVRSEIDQAWFAYQGQKKKVSQYLSGFMDESQKVLEGMVYTYIRGEASIQDVLVAQRTYNEVCEDYLQTMKDYVSALADLENACGFWDIQF